MKGIDAKVEEEPTMMSLLLARVRATLMRRQSARSLPASLQPIVLVAASSPCWFQREEGARHTDDQQLGHAKKNRGKQKLYVYCSHMQPRY
jgi:hypothetical protein